MTSIKTPAAPNTARTHAPSARPWVGRRVPVCLLSATLFACSSPAEQLPRRAPVSDPGALTAGSSAAPTDSPSDGKVIVSTVEPPQGALDETTACESISAQATSSVRTQDIIVVLDNSGSMQAEIDAVEQNINVNLARLLDDSGIDYRMLMFSAYRAGPKEENDRRVCIEPPLGPSACATRTETESPHNGDRFLHFDQPVSSSNAPCLLLQTLVGPPIDTSGGIQLAPTRGDDPRLQAGWGDTLRQDAFKVFIMISDDEVACEVDDKLFGPFRPESYATSFDEQLRNAAPDLFGPLEQERNYSWHSLVGLQALAGDAVYEASGPLVEQTCETASDPAVDHQALSRLTGGLRYPVCNTDSYDAIFRRIASEVVTHAKLPCTFAIPEPPDGKAFNKDRVNLAYTPGDGSQPPELTRAGSAKLCGPSMGWFYNDPENPTAIKACPAACEQFTGDIAGQVEILFGCATKLPTLK